LLDYHFWSFVVQFKLTHSAEEDEYFLADYLKDLIDAYGHEIFIKLKQECCSDNAEELRMDSIHQIAIAQIATRNALVLKAIETKVREKEFKEAKKIIQDTYSQFEHNQTTHRPQWHEHNFWGWIIHFKLTTGAYDKSIDEKIMPIFLIVLIGMFGEDLESKLYKECYSDEEKTRMDFILEKAINLKTTSNQQQQKETISNTTSVAVRLGGDHAKRVEKEEKEQKEKKQQEKEKNKQQMQKQKKQQQKQREAQQQNAKKQRAKNNKEKMQLAHEIANVDKEKKDKEEEEQKALEQKVKEQKAKEEREEREEKEKEVKKKKAREQKAKEKKQKEEEKKAKEHANDEQEVKEK